MTIHQCPKCELRFSWHTELDDHCRSEHSAFRHEYPVHAPAGDADAAGADATEDAAELTSAVRAGEAALTTAMVATWWTER